MWIFHCKACNLINEKMEWPWHDKRGWISVLIFITCVSLTSVFAQNHFDSSKQLTIQDLTTRKFPHLTFDDADMDPCKADIFEGDIAISPVPRRNNSSKAIRRKNEEMENRQDVHQKRRKDRKSHRSKSKKRRKNRAATARKERLWRDAVIPYEIEANFSGEHRTLFKQAMRYWENSTCVQFVERTPEHLDYIFFTQRSCGCCSFVGKRGSGGQAISIGKNCDKFGIVVHELGHVIGFWHEHTRPDRDRHVDIITKNIVAGQEYNFNKLTEEEVNSLGLSYDFDSIMHYARNTFAKSPDLDTILPKGGGFLYLRPVIGQRVRLSRGDIAQTNELYKCPKCGKTCMEPSGKLSSPPPSVDGLLCEWRISATHGERVALNVTFLDIFSTPSCDSDFLEVRDGYWFKSKLLGRFCGSYPLKETLMSTEHRMLVTYKASPGRPIYRGFQATYQTVCGGAIYRDEGILQSPNYPDDYRPNQDCTWTMTVASGYQVALTFEAFEIEKHDNCAYDYVEVRDGTSLASRLLARLCGTQIPDVIRASSNSMLVRFSSDGSVNKMGFSAKFVRETDECNGLNHGCHHDCVNTVGGFECKCRIGFELHSDGKKCEDACGGVLTSGSGIIKSPSFPDLYPSNKRCVWEIQAPNSYTITLNFTHFDLEGTNQACEYDRVEVISTFTGERKVGTVVSQKHGPYCGNRLPAAIALKGMIVTVVFTSDNSVQKSGFAAVFSIDKDECATDNGGCQHICENTVGSYKCACQNGFVLHPNGHDCKEGNCVHHLTTASSIVTSPNYPEHYPSRKDCTWHFSTIPGHRIKLVFEDFEVESHQECAYDYVSLYDGDSVTTAPLLGRFCGAKSPPLTLSTGPNMLMAFRSDPSVQKKGFRALHSTVCGGRMSATPNGQRLFSHARFGDQNYDNRADCHWLLSTSGRRLRLKFESFELEEESDCGYDYVEIFEGFESSGYRIAKFCGSKVPQEVWSDSARVLLRFSTDDTITRKGFSLFFYEVT